MMMMRCGVFILFFLFFRPPLHFYRILDSHTHQSSGYNQLGVSLYGGGLWYTWFDRDLSLAGRVIVSNEQGGFDSRLLYIDRYPFSFILFYLFHLLRVSSFLIADLQAYSAHPVSRHPLGPWRQ
jgi:hypothetical protein